mmetsp:Transcript_22889/g.34154  ORF Transcript_22889/g.34154 Transcript_22889/m.34154 type:complete len:715 (+) Transcript_22889:65-2209(+)|eukprot:CAMPEP_0203675728 /NCGR_PEP_ID=MMETSP0090-20130426/21936_1 /ASSEMBLY_ACC=CAM_ASM_001088 /TAXON_ID=426623 /ORGANISM="Chaetoceros affinis, Strain CCMP159" /LENGTH=714 /DNA_ID=CAMNT_0050542037 /DNA_START=26 /DNA_END=2170 /DNA_ORIENTATION=+
MSSKGKRKDNDDEDPFLLIEKGNSLESSHNQWGSSDYYSRASSILWNKSFNMLMKNKNKGKIVNANSNSNKKALNQEEKKIAALYHDQSVEYLSRARQSLIGALMFEREEDLRRWGNTEPMVDIICRGRDGGGDGNGDDRNGQSQSNLNLYSHELFVFAPLMNILTNEEMDRRVDTFRRLFVAPPVNGNVAVDADIDVDANVKVNETDEDVQINMEATKEYSSAAVQVEVPDEQKGCNDSNQKSSNEQALPPPPLPTTTTTNNNVESIDASSCEGFDGVSNKQEKSRSSHSHYSDEETSTQNDVTSLEKRLNSLVIPSKLNEEESTQGGGANAEMTLALTLEQRLANLDSSLPNKVLQKSDDERLEKIKSGLGNLGVFLPSQNKDNLLNDHSMTDEEQVEMIMNMAKDEVALEKKSAVENGEDDDDGNGDESGNEAVEDILKKAGIRIELPQEDVEADDGLLFNSVNPAEEENLFWSSMDNLRHYSDSNTNNQGSDADPAADPDSDNNDDDWSKKELKTFEDIKCVLVRSQQMLLQASICLEEIDEKMFLPLTNTLNEGGNAKQEDEQGEKGSEEEKDEQGNAESVDDKEENANGVSTVDDEKAEILDTKEDRSKVDVDLDENGSKNPNKDDEDDGEDELLSKDNTGTIDDETHEHGTNEDYTSAAVHKAAANDSESSCSLENTEHKRMRNMGKESLIKAQAYLEQIIKAWPDE